MGPIYNIKLKDNCRKSSLTTNTLQHIFFFTPSLILISLFETHAVFRQRTVIQTMKEIVERNLIYLSSN